MFLYTNSLHWECFCILIDILIGLQERTRTWMQDQHNREHHRQIPSERNRDQDSCSFLGCLGNGKFDIRFIELVLILSTNSFFFVSILYTNSLCFLFILYTDWMFLVWPSIIPHKQLQLKKRTRKMRALTAKRFSKKEVLRASEVMPTRKWFDICSHV